MLDALPRSPDDTLVRRLFFWWVVASTSCVLGAIVMLWLGGQDARTIAAALSAPILPALVVVSSVAMIARARAVRALEVAEARFEDERPASLAATARALRLFGAGDRWMRAWLLIAADAEERGALGVAEEALRRAANAGARGESERALAVRLRLAFVRAARGHVDDAASMLAGIPAEALANDDLRAEHARVQALLHYRAARYREVVDVATSVTPRRARDRKLLEALARSSILRLECAAAPMRIAEEPEPEADEWLDVILPDRRAARL